VPQVISLVAAYVAMAAAFLVIDAVWLVRVARPLFERHVPDLLADQVRLLPAALFYVLFVAGIIWFAVLPGLKSGYAGAALNGALLGLMCYATYEATNMATLKGWSWTMVLADTAWGAALTAITACIGLAVLRAFQPG
jgi:uncharacterized membrane protein